MEKTNTPQVINVEWSTRWQVYYRLKALEIKCSCQTNQPLQVDPNDAQTAIQLWSVVKQCTAKRQELIDWLNRCWQIQSYK